MPDAADPSPNPNRDPDRGPEPPASRLKALALRAWDYLVPPRTRRYLGFHKTYRTLRDTAEQAEKARIPQMAAALSYRTIFGLLPVVVVALVALKQFATEEDMRNLINRALRATGVSAIRVEEADEDAHADWAEEIARKPDEEELEQVQEETSPEAEPPPPPLVDSEEGQRRVDAWITSMIDRVQGINFRVIGAVGLIALLYAAVGMLVEIERAFNQIYKAPKGRSWSRRIVLYWTLLTLGPLALAITILATDRMRASTKTLSDRAGEFITDLSAGSTDTWTVLTKIFAFAFTVVLSGAVLLLLYIAIPNARVKLRPAIVGALVGAICLEAGKWGFAQYIDYTRGQSYVRLYGSVALIPLFLLWVYFTWFVILLGLQIAHGIQFRHVKDPATILLKARFTITEPNAAIDVLASLARRFRSGKAAAIRLVARDAGHPEPVVGVILERLVDAGFIHRVVDSEDKTAAKLSGPAQPRSAAWDDDAESLTVQAARGGGSGDAPAVDPDNPLERWAGQRFSLSRPPDSILLRDVLVLAFQAHEAAHAVTEPDRIAQRLRRVQLDALGDMTLADALDQPRFKLRRAEEDPESPVPA